MDAAVLNHAIMTEVDCNSNTLNAELEVKKLQELVRKLERQNEQLRTRAGASPACVLGGAAGYLVPSPLPVLLCQSSLGSFAAPEEPFDYFHPHSAGDGTAAAAAEEAVEGSEASGLDELELLDLDSLCYSEESDESWLYVLPKAAEFTDDSLTPLQWCRQVLDCPKSEVELARRSLSLQLEQVSRWRSSLSGPSPSASSSSPGPLPLSRVAGVSPVGISPSTKPCSSTPQPSERHAPSLFSPLHPILHRTLSPVGKELSPAAERTPTFLPHPATRSHSRRRSALSPQLSVDSDLGTPEVEDDSITLGYKLQDLTDVQVMARLQEESLRQDYASTSSTLGNRRSQSFTFQPSQLSTGPCLEEEDEEEDEDYGLLPPPQPRLTRLPHSHTFSSIRDWQRSASSLSTPPSTPSTPPYPSAGFAFQPQAQAQSPGLGPGSDKLRRSMPNLVRAPSMPSVPILNNPSASPSLLRNSQSFDSSSGLARLQSSIPSLGQLQNRVQSVGNFSLSRQPLKATAYVSPTIKGSASAGLQSLNGNSGCNSGIPLLSKAASGGGAPNSILSTARSSLPRPPSFVGGTSSSSRIKVPQPARSLLTPPKSLSTLSALTDGTWRDGCY